ncbi:MAG: hypothetical protein ACLVFI_08065 [Christensenellales bacterium]
MRRKLIIDGNAVYEIDEDCMLKKRLDVNGEKDLQEHENKNGEKKKLRNIKRGWSDVLHPLTIQSLAAASAA